MTREEEVYDYFRQFLLKRSGVNIEGNKNLLIDNRMKQILEAEKIPTLEKLMQAIQLEPTGRVAEKVVDLLTTNETSFFRDKYPFIALEKNLFPRLLEQNASSRGLKIWSSACSTGQEAYSIAMLIKDKFPTLHGWNVQIVGTDISRSVVQKATQGLFSHFEISRGLPPGYQDRFFNKLGDEQWQIKDEIKAMVSFSSLNLLESWKFNAPFDLIFCRNVLIYFDKEIKNTVLKKLYNVLAPNGFLVLGSSESGIDFQDLFQIEFIDKTMIYRSLKK